LELALTLSEQTWPAPLDIFFCIVCGGRYPALRTLILRITGNMLAFRLVGRPMNPQPFSPFKGLFMNIWGLPDVLAAQLQRLRVVLVDVERIEQLPAFLALFGAANKPGVLQIEHESETE
jgi:hypothetical protein